MSPEGFDEFLHGFESASHGARAPSLEEPAGPVGAFVLPECIKGFLEQIGPDRLEIVLEEVLEFGVLSGGEIGGSLEEAIAGVVQDGIVAALLELFGFGAPDFIDGFIEFFGDVEAIENIERGGQHPGDDVEVGFPHIGTNDLDLGAALGSEVLEEAGEGVGLAILDDAEQTLASTVDLIDQCHVFVPQAVGDLIDADGGDAIQNPVFQTVIDDPLDGAADGVPGGVEAGGGFLPTQALGPAGEEVAECIAGGVLALCPGDGLDFDSAAGAIDAAHGVGQGDWDVVDGDEFEGSGLGHAIISGAGFVAPGAPRLAVGSGPDFGDDAQAASLFEQCDGMVNEALEGMDFVE